MVAGAKTEFSWKDKLRFRIRDRALRYAEVNDGDHRFWLRCETPVELKRATTALTKEEGTVQWIRSHVKPGDVFYDIGANIGLYTLMAGRRVGPTGRVFAFEPHIANLHGLMHNIMHNNLTDAVRVVSAALHDTTGFFDFNYHHWIAGSSQSQLGSALDDKERPFTPKFVECKYAVTVDELIERGTIRPATHIKVDVDGNELHVMRGMEQLLKGVDRPKTVQIEINPRCKQELLAFMSDAGFTLTSRNYTQVGKDAIAAGQDAEEVHYNGLFTPGR